MSTALGTTNAAELPRRLGGSDLMRNPFSRYAWRRAGRGADLFVAGEALNCPTAFPVMTRSIACLRLWIRSSFWSRS